MRKISNKIIIAVSLLVIALIIFYFQNVKEYEVEIPLSGVIVAKENIPDNTVITQDMIVKEARYTTDLLKQKGDLTSMEEKVLGKRTRVPIYKNEPVHLKRLLENKPYMEEKDSIKKKMFTIAIAEKDKALNIQKGNYIDIWMEFNQNGLMEIAEIQKKLTNLQNGVAGLQNIDQQFGPLGKKLILYGEREAEEGKTDSVYHVSYPIFEKLKVYDVKTEVFTEIKDRPDTNNMQDAKERVVTYLTLYLSDQEIATYLDIKDWNVTKRIALYGDNAEYSIINEKLENTSENESEKEDQEVLSDDMKEVMEAPVKTSGN